MIDTRPNTLNHTRSAASGARTAALADTSFGQQVDVRLAPYGLFALRAALGVMFIAHAWLKFGVFTVPGFEGFLQQVGLPAALAWPIILAEFAGGVAILLGLYGRAVSLILLPVLLGAIVIHAPNGWVFTATNGGWEYPAFLAVAALTHILAGDGAFALKAAVLPQRLARHLTVQTA